RIRSSLPSLRVTTFSVPLNARSSSTSSSRWYASAIASSQPARNPASILRRRYATVIGTRLRRQASLTLHVSARALRNSRALAFDQSRALLLRSCGVAAATSVRLFLVRLPAIPSFQMKSGRASRGGRPDSQFFTVPTLYRISVTLSSTFYLFGFYPVARLSCVRCRERQLDRCRL